MRFVLELGRALSAYGTPAYRVEEVMRVAAESLGLKGQFFSLPTALNASFGEDTKATTHLLRVEPGEVNLGKLVRLDAVFNDVADGRLSPEEGTSRIGQVSSAPETFAPWTIVGCFALASGAACRFLGGGASEILAALGVGMLVGVLSLVMGGRAPSARLLDFISGVAAGFGAAAFSAWIQPVATDIVMLAGAIVLIPGLTLTMAIKELSTRNLVAGTARFMGAMTILVSLGFGAAVGVRLGDTLGAEIGYAHPLPDWTQPIALLVAALAFTVLFRAPLRDLPTLLTAGAIAYYGAGFGTIWAGPELGASFGAFLIGAFSNLYARLFNRPSTVALLPGILLLVPGSIGFRGVSSFMEQETLPGVAATFTMLMVAVSLVVGLLLANVAVPSRKVL